MHAAPESLEIEPEQESANPSQDFLNGVSGWAGVVRVNWLEVGTGVP